MAEDYYYESQIDKDHEWEQYLKEPKSGNFEAVLNMIKAQVGIALLALPYGFYNSGIGYGSIIQSLSVLFSLYGIRKLILIADEVQKPKLYYPELVEQILGEKVEVFAYAGVQAGDLEIIVITAIILVPFIFINNFHFLNTSSGFAIILMIFSLVYILIYDLQEIEQYNIGINSNSQQFFKIEGAIPIIGLAIFNCEGITCVFHIRDSMKKQSDFMKLFSLVLLFLLILQIIFGSINVFTFGKNLQEIVLLNIPYTDVYSFIAKIGYATGILLSYPIQIFPVYTLLQQSMKMEDLSTAQIYKVYGVRMSLLASLFLVAYMIPEFSGLLSFLGAVSGVATQMTFPLWMDYVYQKNHKSKFLKYFDLSLLGLSIVLMVVCGYSTLKDLFI
ncbi:hypothetical protein PPERSA_04387 [Pseudocohnilembus persalinus]|uniref:Amino acid transporter transmembrane domain-containing protein n=1 Tax=Pseudocohnilembus persalinus TaxID=266149 RepID=A0A0V0QQT7_PSEPJ|nr:hypothetical protein PPERSA_04387 [Pseudocohnilembus persalinus]|eukprot:KRX04572.1 hypothetical protein PPERSA_04387 [Pseudocohnilembus persalinus]